MWRDKWWEDAYAQSVSGIAGVSQVSTHAKTVTDDIMYSHSMLPTIFQVPARFSDDGLVALTV